MWEKIIFVMEPIKNVIEAKRWMKFCSFVLVGVIEIC